ncbi:MAG: DUF948 domain-containing protein [Solibacillus sp.]|uniref:DUF948 domain-containing protein n=1 Tax=unclassified Solibacillus TaxID=2637870 RepID=UPI0030FAAF2D
MNAWLLAAIIVLILAVVVFVGCLAIVVVPLRNTIKVLLTHVQGIQKQLEGIQTQTVALTVTMDRIKKDIDNKKETIQLVIQSVKETSTVLNKVSESSQAATTAIVRQLNTDSEKQAQTEQWINTAMKFINRKAQ